MSKELTTTSGFMQLADFNMSATMAEELNGLEEALTG